MCTWYIPYTFHDFIVAVVFAVGLPHDQYNGVNIKYRYMICSLPCLHVPYGFVLPHQWQTWLADLMTSWFKLTPPDASAAVANKANKSMESTATEEVRATIREVL